MWSFPGLGHAFLAVTFLAIGAQRARRPDSGSVGPRADHLGAADATRAAQEKRIKSLEAQLANEKRNTRRGRGRSRSPARGRGRSRSPARLPRPGAANRRVARPRRPTPKRYNTWSRRPECRSGFQAGRCKNGSSCKFEHCCAVCGKEKGYDACLCEADGIRKALGR